MTSRAFRRACGLMLVGLVLPALPALGQFRAGFQIGRQQDCPGGVCPVPGIQGQPSATLDPESESTVDPAEVTRWSSTVRLHSGNAGGSGVVLFGEQDDGLILTCAHLFSTTSTATIDVYGSTARDGIARRALRLTGQLVRGDRKLDLAIIRFKAGRSLPRRPLVAREYLPTRGTAFVTSGFPGGRGPMIGDTKVVGMNLRRGNVRLIECSAPTIEGQSGGPLFTTDGQLAGICNARADDVNTGIFSPVSPGAWSLLDDCRLTSLLDTPAAPATVAMNPPRSRANPAPPSPVKPTAVESSVEIEIGGISIESTVEAVDPQTGQTHRYTQAQFDELVATSAAKTQALKPPLLTPIEPAGTPFHWTHGVGIAAFVLMIVGVVCLVVFLPRAFRKSAQEGLFRLPKEMLAEAVEARVAYDNRSKASKSKWDELAAKFAPPEGDGPKP